MKVCIAEKPSVAREIAQILNANVKKDGYFEGNGYQVTWTFGHFCTLYSPGDYNSYWKRWDLNTLPMLPDKFETRVMDDKGVRKQYNIIKGLFDHADEVFPSASYQYVLYGMGFKTEARHTIKRSDNQQLAQMTFRKNAQLTEKLLAGLPSNRELINKIHQYGLQKI